MENDMPDLPESASDKIESDKIESDKIHDASYVHNIMYNKEWLTTQEATMLINSLSGSMLIDGIRHGKSKEADKKYL